MKDYIEDEINRILYDNIDALLVVSTEEDKYRTIKCSGTFSRYIAEEGCYEELIEKLSFHISGSDERITEEYRVFLPKMAEFKSRISQRVSVKIDGVSHVIQMIVYPLEKSENDYVILLFDMDRAEVERTEATNSKVKTIQETYLFSMYVDLNKDVADSINVSEISNDALHYDVKYSEWRMMIVNMIWPEDQAMFLEKSDPEFLKQNLRPAKTLSFDCQMKNLEGEYIWVKLIFGRTDTINENDFRFVFMVENIHENSMKLFNELKKFEELASVDAMTGLYNHGRAETELGNALDFVKSNKGNVSLMMIDIDRFKIINDIYGHAVGDDAIKEFVDCINTSIQGYNIKAGRWGGEEFVCICYSMNLEEAHALAEKIRVYVCERDFKNIGKMTCSIGVTSIGNEDTVREAFERVDKILYRAKEEGRNRVLF